MCLLHVFSPVGHLSNNNPHSYSNVSVYTVLFCSNTSVILLFYHVLLYLKHVANVMMGENTRLQLSAVNILIYRDSQKQTAALPQI